MRFFVAGRQTGKTTAMLKWMTEAPEGEHRICVSHTSEVAMRLLREVRELGLPLESWQFVGIGELRNPGIWGGVLRGRGGRIVLGFDDLELILPSIFRWPVEFVTATGTLAEAPTVGREVD